MATVTTQQDLHHLRSLLQPHGAARVKDPDFVDKEKDNTPPIATPTKGPHRMTFVVPHDDESVVNIGKADPGPGRIKETGITGMTKTHVHWQTTEEAKTIVSLGGPAKSLTVPSSQDNLIAKIEGYGLFTEKDAWMDSKEQFSMVSREKDISMRTKGEGKVASVQSDSGKALLFGGDNATVASPKGVVIGSAPSMTAQNVTLEATWTDKWRQDVYAKVGQTINTVGEIGTSALSIFKSIATTKTVGKEGETGPGTRPRVGSKAKLIADLGLFVSSVVHGWDEVMGHEPPGTTAIHAEKNASMTAGDSAAVYGQVSASLSSLASASVIGGISAVLKGILWTEVASSLGTGITSIKDVEIAACKGKLEMSAKKEAVLAVEEGSVLITAGKEMVQVNCNEGHAALHGSEGAFVGAGSNFGMQVETGGLKIGKANAAGKFKAPGMDASAGMEFKADEIKIVMSSSQIEMKAASTKIANGGVSVEWSSSGLTITAPAIHLG